MGDPQVKQKLADQGLTVAGDTPEHFRDYIAAETKKWARVIKAAGIGLEVRVIEVKRHARAPSCADARPVAAPAAAAT